MNSILVIQLKRLGDVILTTPALSALCQMFPRARITLLLHRQGSAVAPAISNVDEVWFHDRKSKLWLDLLRNRFDVCLDFTGNDRSALFTFLSKAPRRLGFSFVTKYVIRSWVYTELALSPVQNKHTIDHYLDLVRLLGNPGPNTAVSLWLPEGVERSAETLRREIGLPERYFVIHPGTARREKYWLPDQWATIIAWVQQRWQIPCLITGGQKPFELQHINEIMQRLGDRTSVLNLAGKVDFLTAAAMIRGAAFFVGVDTAAAHLASAFGIPEVVLFGPTNPYHWQPRHTLGKVVRSGFEAPLTLFEPRQKGAPMNELSTDVVFYAIEAALKDMNWLVADESSSSGDQLKPALLPIKGVCNATQNLRDR
jgi:ADP-heptose:LPS heptosyltransferase